MPIIVATINMKHEVMYIVSASCFLMLCDCEFCVIAVSSMLGGNGFVIGVVSLSWGVDVLG